VKNLKKLGKALTKAEQKKINGGFFTPCTFSADPSTDWCCHLPGGCPSNG